MAMLKERASLASHPKPHSIHSRDSVTRHVFFELQSTLQSLQPYTPSRMLPSSNQDQLTVPLSMIKLTSTRISASALSLWNKLAASVRAAEYRLVRVAFKHIYRQSFVILRCKTTFSEFRESNEWQLEKGQTSLKLEQFFILNSSWYSVNDDVQTKITVCVLNHG